MAERVYCLYRVSTTKQIDHNDQNQAHIPMQRKTEMYKSHVVAKSIFPFHVIAAFYFVILFIIIIT